MSIVIISGLVICKHLWQSELKFLRNSLKLPWLPPLRGGKQLLQLLKHLERCTDKWIGATEGSNTRKNNRDSFIVPKAEPGSSGYSLPVTAWEQYSMESIPVSTWRQRALPTHGLPAFQRTHDLACIELSGVQWPFKPSPKWPLKDPSLEYCVFLSRVKSDSLWQINKTFIPSWLHSSQCQIPTSCNSQDYSHIKCIPASAAERQRAWHTKKRMRRLINHRKINLWEIITI